MPWFWVSGGGERSKMRGASLIAVDVTCHRWCRPRWPGGTGQASPCNVTPFLPASILSLWEEVALRSPHLGGRSGRGEAGGPSGGWSSYIHYMEFFCLGDLSFLPPIYLLIQSCICITMNPQIFSLCFELYFNNIFLFCCPDRSSSGYWEVFWGPVSSLTSSFNS